MFPALSDMFPLAPATSLVWPEGESVHARAQTRAHRHEEGKRDKE